MVAVFRSPLNGAVEDWRDAPGEGSAALGGAGEGMPSPVTSERYIRSVPVEGASPSFFCTMR